MHTLAFLTVKNGDILNTYQLKCLSIFIYISIHINKYTSLDEIHKLKTEQIAKVFVNNETIYILY